MQFLWRVVPLLLLPLVLGGCQPLAWLVAAPLITPTQLAALPQGEAGPVLLDLRTEAEYGRGHIASAHRVDFGDVAASVRALGSSRQVVLICKHARLAALAVPSVRGAGHGSVAVLDGGMQGWLDAGLPVNSSGGSSPLTLQRNLVSVGWAERVLAYGAGVVIKPSYMLLSLGLILWLRRSAERDLRLMRLGLIAFLAGEVACLFGFYLSDARAVFQPWEWLHGLGMAVGVGYGFWSLFLMFDGRMLAMLDPERNCALVRFCGKCHKQKDVPCLPQRLLRVAILLTLPLAAMPWTQTLRVQDLETDLFGTCVDYRWPVVNQLIELRLYPLLAALLLVWAWIRMAPGRRSPGQGQLPLFMGLGFLGFSLLRLFLSGVFYHAPYWGDIWEETTELMGILGTLVLLWTFREKLGLASSLRQDTSQRA